MKGLVGQGDSEKFMHKSTKAAALTDPREIGRSSQVIQILHLTMEALFFSIRLQVGGVRPFSGLASG